MSIWTFLINNIIGYRDGRAERKDTLQMGTAEDWSTQDMPIPDDDADIETHRRYRVDNLTHDTAIHGRAIFGIIIEPGRAIGRAGGIVAAFETARGHAVSYYEVYKTECRLQAAALAAHADGELTKADRDAIMAKMPENASTDMRGYLLALLEEPPTLKQLLKRVPRNQPDFKHEIFELSAAVIGPAPSPDESAYLQDLWDGLRLVTREEERRAEAQTNQRRTALRL